MHLTALYKPKKVISVIRSTKLRPKVVPLFVIMFQPTITNDEINLLPLASFQGEIVVVDSDDSMSRAEAILEGETLLGYDTESRPAFTKGLSYGVSLVQISLKDTALLFRIQECPLSPRIIAMLEDPRVLKIGAAIRDDIRGMQRIASFRPGGFIDLQTTVSRWDICEISVKKMAAIILGIKVSKAQRLSNWEAVRLTPAQQDYAAMDAWVCRKIYSTLMKTPLPDGTAPTAPIPIVMDRTTVKPRKRTRKTTPKSDRRAAIDSKPHPTIEDITKDPTQQ